MEKIYFSKTREGAKIPCKRIEDAGFDIYPCFNEDYIIIPPNESRMIPTGLASAFENNYVMVLFERGSTGVKNMARRAGIIDSGFRNEWQVVIYNGNTKPVVIHKENHVFDEENYISYPYSKAIAQALLLPVPPSEIKEILYSDLKNIKSERGLGMLGSSGK